MAEAPSPSAAAAAEVAPVSTPLLRRRGSYTRSMSHARDELGSFRSCLRWMCVDHSDGSSAVASWLVFVLLAVVVPAAARVAMPRGPYDTEVQASLTLSAALAYVTLSSLMASWMYRTAMFFMACVLFRIICFLQILRMTGFARDFGQCADVADVLRQHGRIRDQLRRISHRYRRFILFCLLLVTASQFSALLAATRPRAQVNIATAGELALCSMSLVTGLLICLHSAAKITHKTQAITSVAAAWHADATINSLDHDHENPRTPIKASHHFHASPVHPTTSSSGEESDDDESSRSDDGLDSSRFTSFHATHISYQKRQALVTYLENNRAGITVFGFVVDRTWLHALFMLEFSLVMWLLGKTIGIS
ncbi:hypothetical protein ABZP36_007589 [Zizania latifolia]